MSSGEVPTLPLLGHPLLCQLAASPCTCRSKTQLLTNTEYSSSQLYQLDVAGLGGQRIAPSTVNLGLTLRTGWTCLLNRDFMQKVPIQVSMHSLLSKQLAKFRPRLAAAVKANLSIHAKIIYFNTFSLSLFYYAQTHRYFAPPLLKPLYQAMAKFLLRLCRWLRIGPLLDPAIMHAVSMFGCYLRQGSTSFSEEQDGSYARQVQQCWAYWQMQLPLEDIQRLLAILRQPDTRHRELGVSKHTLSKSQSRASWSLLAFTLSNG